MTTVRQIAIVCSALAAMVLAFGASSPAAAGDFPLADKVLVEKGKRKLHLLRNGMPFRTFDIALGPSPDGDKEQEGDQKTPEGYYMLDARNPDSDFFLSIHVSYPNARDLAEARQKGCRPWWCNHDPRTAESAYLLGRVLFHGKTGPTAVLRFQIPT